MRAKPKAKKAKKKAPPKRGTVSFRGRDLGGAALEDYVDRIAENAAEIGTMVGSDMESAVEQIRAREGDADSPHRLVNNAICNAARVLTDAETDDPEFYDRQDWFVLCDRLARRITLSGELHPALQLDGTEEDA